MVNESRSNGRRIDNNSPFFAVPNGAATCDWPDLTTRRTVQSAHTQPKIPPFGDGRLLVEIPSKRSF